MTQPGQRPLTEADLGRIAYEAYGANAEWTNVRGEPMPQWNDLGGTIQSHWVSAATTVAAATRPNP